MREVSKTVRRVRGNLRRFIRWLRDCIRPSFLSQPHSFRRLARLVPAGIIWHPTNSDVLAANYFMEHRFDLLGAGWVKVHYGMECGGFDGFKYKTRWGGRSMIPSETIAYPLNRPNRKFALGVRKLIDENYDPIDWQIDYKSGYRWSERKWYRNIQYGSVAGADIKVPWELSRLQHLPELAIVCAATRDDKYAKEFANQVLDWIASNPPRFGVNWACTMDVGIRVANLLIAYDCFVSAGVKFEEAFERQFISSVVDHSWHIVENLEWSELRRSNHYLADICGLLVAAAYLPVSWQTDGWLAFAVQEMMVEADRQFLRDGGHFEASTSYHRLCGEMIAFCAALCESLSQTRIQGLFRADPNAMCFEPRLRASTGMDLERNYKLTGKLLSLEFYATLRRAAHFTRGMTKPDGTVIQIGDNDSGRFMRMGGWIEEGTVSYCRDRYGNLAQFGEIPDVAPYLVQPVLNHHQWLAWASALLGESELLDQIHERIYTLPLTLAVAWAKRPLPSLMSEPVNRDVRHGVSLPSVLTKKREKTSITHRLSSTYRPGGKGLLDEATCQAYVDFGAYVLRSNRVHLIIRCGYARQDGVGVHAHEDQLAVELSVDNKQVTVDPGTYVYTPSRILRNAYRNAQAHAAPSVVGATGDDERPIFSPPRHYYGRCIEFDIYGFVGWSTIDGGEVTRRISLFDDRIEIADDYSLDPPWKPAAGDLFRPAKQMPLSPGYGVQLRERLNK